MGSRSHDEGLPQSPGKPGIRIQLAQQPQRRPSRRRYFLGVQLGLQQLRHLPRRSLRGHPTGHQPIHLSLPKIDLSTLNPSHAFDGIGGTATRGLASNGPEIGATNTAAATGNAAATGASAFVAQSLAAEQSPGLGITTFPGAQDAGLGTTLDNPGDPNAGADLTLVSPLIPLAGQGNILINPAVLQVGHILATLDGDDPQAAPGERMVQVLASRRFE